MISKHDEIEAKLEADHVPFKRFEQWVVKEFNVRRSKVANSPDYYYHHNVSHSTVRHRQGFTQDRPHELTVKRRKSDDSTRDRQEIDLHFAGDTKPADVDAFLRATGYHVAFVLTKEAHIFWVQLTDNLEVSFVIYDVWEGLDRKKAQGVRRFIEVEAEKGSEVSAETAKRHINRLVAALQFEFDLKDPLNESLWEIYSGARYQTV